MKITFWSVGAFVFQLGLVKVSWYSPVQARFTKKITLCHTWLNVNQQNEDIWRRQIKTDDLNVRRNFAAAH